MVSHSCVHRADAMHSGAKSWLGPEDVREETVGLVRAVLFVGGCFVERDQRGECVFVPSGWSAGRRTRRAFEELQCVQCPVSVFSTRDASRVHLTRSGGLVTRHFSHLRPGRRRGPRRRCRSLVLVGSAARWRVVRVSDGCR